MHINLVNLLKVQDCIMIHILIKINACMFITLIPQLNKISIHCEKKLKQTLANIDKLSFCCHFGEVLDGCMH